MKKKLRKSIKADVLKFLEYLQNHGIDYSFSLIFPGKGKHDGLERISAKDDHHMLDLINNQLQAWTFLNHKEK